MNIIASKIKEIIEGQGLDYFRSVNINDLNQQVGETDLQSGVGVYTSLPKIEHTAFGLSQNILMDYDIEVYYLRLNNETDDKGEAIDVILDDLFPKCQELFDLLRKSGLVAPSDFIKNYTFDAVDTLKFTKEVLTGWRVQMSIPMNRLEFFCDVDAVTPPAAPTNLITTDIQPTTTDFAWTDNSDNEDGFSFQYFDGFQWLTADILPPNTTTYHAALLTPETEYIVRVEAFNSAGTSFSNELTFSTIAEPPAYSPEVMAVLERMEDLTQLEIDSIAVFVDAEVLAGNYALYDEFYCMSLSGVNALTGFLDKKATNNGATFDINGASFNGIDQYINSNYDTSLDAVNYLLDNAQMEAFIINDNVTSGGAFFGNGSNLSARAWILPKNNWGINGDLSGGSGIPLSGNNVLYSMFTPDNINASLNIDGVLTYNQSRGTTGTPTGAVAIGARNWNAVLDSYGSSTISTFMAGGVLPNQAAHNTNLRAFLTSLGAI